MRHNFVWVAGEINEQLKFLWSKLEFEAADRNHMRVQIDAEIAILNDSSTDFFLRSASQICTDSRKQFINPESFSHVVVGHGIERLHLRSLIAFHREHDDRA